MNNVQAREPAGAAREQATKPFAFERMNFIHTLIAIGIVGGGYTYWKDHHGAPATVEAGVPSDGRGFESVPSVDEHNSSEVFVVAAQNCPGADARRADRLAGELSSKGIPVRRTHNVSFNFSEAPTSSTMERVNGIMTGPLPIVFVNGRAKSNPSVDEVVAEFNRRRH